PSCSGAPPARPSSAARSPGPPSCGAPWPARLARMSVRLDKWLQVARMYKTRTQATHACDLGRVRVNGQPAKPHRNLSLGDRVELQQGDWERVLTVRELRDRPVPKAEAAGLYDDQSPPRPAPDPMRRLLSRPP